MTKHISFRSGELLNALIKENLQFFTLKKAENLLLLSNPQAVRSLLSDMTRRGLVLRLKDGLYSVIPYEKNSVDYFPNWHLAAEALVHPNKYYIGFYTALDIHGLITQPSLVEQVVTAKQIVPKYQEVKNIRFEFITLSHKRFFGYEKIWIDNFNKIFCSDLEKTFLDCLFKPGYSGGISEIAKALYHSSRKINSDKVIDYLEKYDVQAVNKRLVFLLYHLNILKPLVEIIKDKLSKSYIILDPSLPKDGKEYPEWKIIDNVGIEAVLKSIES